jgi:hypothetical protein
MVGRTGWEIGIPSISCDCILNSRSVGNPLDLTQSSYAILEGKYGGRADDTFSVYLIRVPYDIELAIKQAKDEGMPDLEPYENELRTARYRGAVALVQAHSHDPSKTRG